MNSHTWRWRWNKHVQRGYMFFEHVCRPKTLLLWNAVFLQAHHTFKHQLLNLELEYVATGLAMTSCLFRWSPCEKYMWLISHKPVLDAFHYSKIMTFGSSKHMENQHTWSSCTPWFRWLRRLFLTEAPSPTGAPQWKIDELLVHQNHGQERLDLCRTTRWAPASYKWGYNFCKRGWNNPGVAQLPIHKAIYRGITGRAHLASRLNILYNPTHFLKVI